MDSYRSERPSKRLRRLSTEDDSEDGNSSVAPNSASRPRRAAASGTTIERSSPAEDRTTSIRLTVKSDPKKLQQATRGQQRSGRSNILPDLAEIVSGPRQTRKKAIVEESSEEEDEDEQTPAGYGDDDDDLSDEDAEGEEDEDEDMDAEGEDDEEMVPVPPPVRASAPKGQAAKPQVKITPAQEMPSVEDKEMAMDDDDDDELSELDEDAEGELDDELGGEEDAEGEEDEDSDEDISASASRGDTPDLSKLTSRQRRQFEDADDGSLLALSNEAQKKKVLTEEEHNMRRTEMARRRKNLSEKRNEEEKQDTINRLLKKQAPKRRSKADREADLRAEEEADPDRVIPKANPVYTRIVMTNSGTHMSIPEGWEGASFAPYLEHSKPEDKTAKPYSGRLVEENEKEEEQESSEPGGENHFDLTEQICDRLRTGKPCTSVAEAAKFMKSSVFLKSCCDLVSEAGASVASPGTDGSQMGEDEAGVSVACPRTDVSPMGENEAYDENEACDENEAHDENEACDEDESSDEESTTDASIEEVPDSDSDEEPPPKKCKLERSLAREIEDHNKTGEKEQPQKSRHERKGNKPNYSIKDMDQENRRKIQEAGFELV